MTGAERIAVERQRQIEKEGWTPEHDAEHGDGSLVTVASIYAHAALISEQAAHGEEVVRRTMGRLGKVPEDDEDFRQMLENPARHYFGWDRTPSDWPWDPGSWKPSEDPIPNLVKAGALIAAEIDRLDALATEDGTQRIDREPQRSDGPDYHAEHEAWQIRAKKSDA